LLNYSKNIKWNLKEKNFASDDYFFFEAFFAAGFFAAAFAIISNAVLLEFLTSM